MKKIVLKLIVAVILLLTVIGIIISLNSQYKQNYSDKEQEKNKTNPIHQADELIDRNMLIQITEKDSENINTYNIDLSEEGILFKYLDKNQKTSNTYDRYTIISEKQLSYNDKKTLQEKINKLSEKENLNSKKIYTIIYAGEEKVVDISELNNVLSEYGITF